MSNLGVLNELEWGPVAVTEAVVRSLSGTSNPRLKEVCESLVRHLHAAVCETNLTRSELELGLEFINEVGQATNSAHNEAVLLSDVFGLTTIVCHNDEDWQGEEALLGPFWRLNSPSTENGGSIVRSPTPGTKLNVAGQIVDANGAPISQVELDVWQASPCGLYENQDSDQVDMNLRGKLTTDAEGRFSFETVMPTGYPVPTEGPVGRLLQAQKRHPFRPAHIHFLASKEGYRTLITQVFVAEDPHLDSDVVFGVNDRLVGKFSRQGEGDGLSYSLERTFTMRAGESKLPHPPID